MKWDQIKNRLEEVLSTPFKYEVLEDFPERNQLHSWVEQNVVYFPLEYDDNNLFALTVDISEITPHERDLIELMLQASKSNDHLVLQQQEDQGGLSYVQELRNWLMRQLKSGVQKAELPSTLHAHMNLYASKIPLLLYADTNESDPLQYEEFKRLLGTFFETDLILVPLAENEWLILASEAVIRATQGEIRSGEQEELEEALESIALGLHEMLVSEWVGDCHLAVDIPMVPAKDLLETILKLRQMISLGRQYHLESHLHLPWKLKLERLLHLIPDEGKSQFVEEVLRRMDYGFDFETLQTLEQFFELDCNVSETARMLYIHRNTLLYRLDKFKQETGLDVRSFNDAVLVNIALLLYKVTKRK